MIEPAMFVDYFKAHDSNVIDYYKAHDSNVIDYYKAHDSNDKKMCFKK